MVPSYIGQCLGNHVVSQLTTDSPRSRLTLLVFQFVAQIQCVCVRVCGSETLLRLAQADTLLERCPKDVKALPDAYSAV